MTRSMEDEIVRHYTHGTLEQAIRAGLAAAGCGPETVRPEDLAPVDEFHMGGHGATVALAEQMGLAPGMALLDLGCGIGGPARHFARTYGCAVVGIDLTPEYVSVAEMLNRLVGSAEGVAFRVGSATDLPFEAGAFDAVSLLHVGMNIADKAALCAEAARVLKPGGVMAIYDAMRTGDGEPDFPVPWATTADMSFLAEPAAYRHALEAAGFEVTAERDRRGAALEFFDRLRARLADGGPPPLGLHLLMGAEAKRKLANMIAALERGVVAPVEMIARRG